MTPPASKPTLSSRAYLGISAAAVVVLGGLWLLALRALPNHPGLGVAAAAGIPIVGLLFLQGLLGSVALWAAGREPSARFFALGYLVLAAAVAAYSLRS